MNASDLKRGLIVNGPMLPEPIEVLVVDHLGDMIKLTGAGQRTKQVHQRVLHPDQLKLLDANPEREPFDGDPARFRLGVEAARLALAYEYDPYFSLSIARVDPLPHQLEAVYDYFMPLPRIRFLLADDPGAGKTIMAGLLLKELKVRGLVKRTLIVTPASLSFQWQRELKDKFRESFEVIRSDVLRANYGQNPWQEKNQVITSISWVSRIEDAKESLLRSRWDLVIVDEAHKMAAYSADKKTLAYRLGESLSSMTDHYLLMTATPHKGDPENFCLFLELLDRDIYGNVKSLEEAMRRNHAPFYLRRTKEAMVTFPDPETGEVKKLFTNLSLAELENRRIEGESIPGLEGIIAQAEAHLDELNNRLENRRVELKMEAQLSIGDIEALGRAWVLPHPERTSPGIAPMVRDEEIERIAVAEAIRYETARGWVVESVESENKGFDLISRKPHPHDDKTFSDVRFIEVKGRAKVGEVALSANEYKTAERLKQDYWLYVVFNCASTPELHAIQDPVRLGWKAVVQVAHYHVGAEAILATSRRPAGG